MSIIHLLYTSQSHVKDAHEVAVPLKFKADGTSMKVWSWVDNAKFERACLNSLPKKANIIVFATNMYVQDSFALIST